MEVSIETAPVTIRTQDEEVKLEPPKPIEVPEF